VNRFEKHSRIVVISSYSKPAITEFLDGIMPNLIKAKRVVQLFLIQCESLVNIFLFVKFS
jgi:hypothetical protein